MSLKSSILGGEATGSRADYTVKEPISEGAGQ